MAEPYEKKLAALNPHQQSARAFWTTATRSTVRSSRSSSRSRAGAFQHKSSVAMMLAPSSTSALAVAYRRVHLFSIISSVALYALSTMKGVTDTSAFRLAEGALSWAFAADYACRLYACREHKRYAQLGAITARLRWAISYPALLDAVSFVPFLVDNFLITPGDRSLPSFAWVRVCRVFLLFQTSRWAGAVRTVGRVLFVNREILYTSLALVSLTIVLTATLLHAACNAEDGSPQRCARDAGITDLPSAMYVTTLMLTGQASPEGQLPTSVRLVVLLTAFLSVPFFAVPAAMLTWGFEGEAQRLAARERQRGARRRAYAEDMAALLSSSSSDEAYEDYLEGVGGGESDEETKEAAAEQAIHFFRAAARGRGTGTSKNEFLFRAHALSTRLRTQEQEAARARQQKRDALALLEKV